MLIGAVVAWLLLSIPNDLKADAILKDARADIEAGKRDEAREELLAVVQQYPRTDAAATAMAILFRMSDQDRDAFRKKLDSIASEQKKTAGALQAVTRAAQAQASAAPAASPTPVPQASASPTPASPKPKPRPSPTPSRKSRRH